MSPEELAEARHYATCYQAGYVHDLMHNFLAQFEASDIEYDWENEDDRSI
jgi:hypothetical protein